MDIFAKAEENSGPLEAAFKVLLAECLAASAARLEKFSDGVSAKGRVCMNMRPSIAAELLRCGKYRNMYQVTKEQAEVGKLPEDELLRRRLGKHFKKRTTFDSKFQDGKEFKYGALNIGGVGARRYGTFCIVLKDTFPETDNRVAYVKTDSLNGYTDDKGSLDDVSFQKDLACHSHRHRLAALKHVDDLERRNDEWPTMLCSDDDYIEAIFTADVETPMIDEVRISASDHTRLFELCYDAHGRKLCDEEFALAHDFYQILLANHNGTITLTEVPDA